MSLLRPRDSVTLVEWGQWFSHMAHFVVWFGVIPFPYLVLLASGVAALAGSAGVAGQEEVGMFKPFQDS